MPFRERVVVTRIVFVFEDMNCTRIVSDRRAVG